MTWSLALALALCLQVPCGSANAADAADEGASERADPAQRAAEAPSPAPRSPSAEPVPSDPWAGVEEMIVVGGSVTGMLLDSAVSVTGFSQEDLLSIGAVNVSDVSQYTPNLEIRTLSGTTPTFFIRGVGLNDFTANASGAIAIYMDDVPLDLPAIQLGQLFDTQGVAVLRGPQGSGPGRNASGGAIKIDSRRPTGEPDAYLRTSYGRFNAADVEGALEVPIVDSVSTRLAFRFSRRDPIVENGCGNLPPIGLERVQNPNRPGQNGLCGESGFVPVRIPNPDPPPPEYRVSPLQTGLEKWLNDKQSWGARGQIRWTPDAVPLDLLLNVHGSAIHQRGTVGQVIGTNGFFGGDAGLRTLYRPPEIAAEELAIRTKLVDRGVPASEAFGQARSILSRRLARGLDTKPFRGDYNVPGRERQTALGGFLRADLEIADLEISVISGVESYDRYRRLDADYTPNVIFETETDDKAWQLTEEIRVAASSRRLPVDWATGAFLIVERLDFESVVQTTAPLLPLTRAFVQETVGGGIYADVDWRPFENVTLEAGARLNLERKNFDVSLLRGTDPVGGAICETRVIDGRTLEGENCVDEVDWIAPTGTVTLRYDFTEDIAGYVKYSHGWKSGQYNAGGASGQSFTLAEPEEIDAYEIGLKAGLFGGMLNVSGSLFYYQYQEYQVFLSQNDYQSPPQRIVLNASDAEVYGAELELDAEPIDDLKLDLRLGWLESEFLDFTQLQFRQIPSGSIQDPPVIVPVAIDFTGNRLPNTPRFKVSTSIEYRWEIGAFGRLIPRYDLAWTDDVFFDPSDGRGSPDNSGRIFMPDFAIGQRGYVLQNVRLAYQTPEEGIEVAFWVRNLTDQTYKTLAYDASASAGLVGNLVGDPRTYGVQVALNW
ncbi:MAG: TonB-dependent receptor [Myxococcota bacterium]